MTDSPATLYRWDDVPSERVTESLTRRLVTGERMMLAHLRLEEGTLVPMHSHENEQLSWVLEGALRFVIGGGSSGSDEGPAKGRAPDGSTRGGSGRVEIVVRAGEVLHLPSHVPHSAEALEDTVGVDIFSPPRRDWLDGTDGYLRGGAVAGEDS